MQASAAPVLNTNGTGPQLRPPGAPLGVSLEACYIQDDVIIRPGEYIVLFSEGLINARNARGETFGSLRLAKAIEGQADGAQQVVDSVMAALKDFTGRDKAQTDLTLIVLGRSAGDGPRDGRR